MCEKDQFITMRNKCQQVYKWKEYLKQLGDLGLALTPLAMWTQVSHPSQPLVIPCC